MAAVLLLVWLLARSAVPWIRARRERRERASLRLGLRPIPVTETDRTIDALPDNVYGFEVIFAVAGLKKGGGKVKPEPLSADGASYPVEVHKVAGEASWIGPAVGASLDVKKAGSADPRPHSDLSGRPGVESWGRRSSQPVVAAVGAVGSDSASVGFDDYSLPAAQKLPVFRRRTSSAAPLVIEAKVGVPEAEPLQSLTVR